MRYLSLFQNTTYAQQSSVPVNLHEQVKRYRAWLTTEAKDRNLSDRQEEISHYVTEALKAIKVRNKEVVIFAPFRHKFSALHTLTGKQLLTFSALVLVLVLGLLFFGIQILVAAIAVTTVFYFGNLVLDFFLAVHTLGLASGEHIDDAIVHGLAKADWPRYTILCPLYREAKVVPQFVRAMQALDYPTDKLQILFLTEECDGATRQALEALHLPAHFTIVTVPEGQPRTKPRACNYGLLQATGDYIVIYDAEDIPDPLQLKKAVLTFANHNAETACVQAKLNFYNTQQNLLARWFTAEYSMWFDLILPGLQKLRIPFPLGGTSNHFRADTLRLVGGWDAFNVTEDCDLGLRMARYGFKTVMLDSTTYEEANSRVKNWLRQRSRWIKGYIQTYLVYMREPHVYLRRGGIGQFVSLQLVVGGKTVVLFTNPVMWLLLAMYVLFHPLQVYHTLFPAPVFYMGTLCLVFGNFFYTYIHVVGCMKRGHYDCVGYALLIPFYWLLISGAGFFALFEIVMKPHYWQKTMHGLHLGVKQRSRVNRQQGRVVAVTEEPVARSSAMAALMSKINHIPGVTRSLQVLPALVTPMISQELEHTQGQSKRGNWRDPWLLATLITACLASVTALWHYFRRHEILLYGDALSHLRISRGVFDNLTPGLAQLGSPWLPLPHILMWPFIWNDYLWHSGLAGSFVSMICYVVTAVFLFLSARRLTGSVPSFIGVLLFILNPNVLYLQATPMSELVCLAILAITGYYFLSWTQEGELRQLIFTAGASFLATLARYDGWALFLVMLCLIPLVSWLKHQPLSRMLANMITFGALGGLGIVLWLLWNGIIFGDPLYFQKGAYSAQAQQLDVLRMNVLYTYHNLWQSIRYYTIDTEQTIGLILLVLTAIALVRFVLHYRLTPRTCGAFVFLTPFAFYVVALYGGQAVIWIPGAVPPNSGLYMFNVRYGVQMVAPAALFIATLLETIKLETINSSLLLRLRPAGYAFLLGIIVSQNMLMASQGIISLQDGQFNSVRSPQTVQYLAQHYNGGKILQDMATGHEMSEAPIDFKNFIYQGAGALWQQALQDPAGTVEWVIVRPSPKDLVAKYIDVNNPHFLSQFTLVAQQTDGLRLYHHKGRPPLPTRPGLPRMNEDAEASFHLTFPNMSPDYALGGSLFRGDNERSSPLLSKKRANPDPYSPSSQRSLAQGKGRSANVRSLSHTNAQHSYSGANSFKTPTETCFGGSSVI